MKPLAAFVFLFAAYALVGTLDYHHLHAEAKERAAKRADEAKAARQAPIWSQRCEKKGMDLLAVQADGGKWEIRCIPKRTLQVKA